MLPPGVGLGVPNDFQELCSHRRRREAPGAWETDLRAATTASKKGCEAEAEKANLVIIKLNNKTKTKMPTQSEEFVFPGSLVR